VDEIRVASVGTKPCTFTPPLATLSAQARGIRAQAAKMISPVPKPDHPRNPPAPFIRQSLHPARFRAISSTVATVRRPVGKDGERFDGQE
jgi:hypothetical protein